MSHDQKVLTRPLKVMSGVNDLFAQVLGGVRLPIFAEGNYELVLSNIRSELQELQGSSKGRYDFQNLAVANAPRIKYLQMAELHYGMAFHGFPAMINIEPIGWRSRVTGFPLFGVLRVESPKPFVARNPMASVFSLTVDSISFSSEEGPTVTFEPNIPPEMKELYFPTAVDLIKASGRGTSVFISAEFAGEMPLDLENYIHEVENSGYLDSLWAVFLVPEWKFGRIVRVIKKDPIIIGRFLHKVLGPVYFFLGIFDPEKSDWDQAVAGNYTPGPQFLLRS